MKKLLLVLAAAFAMVACQTDLNEVNVAGGEVDVTFEVGAPAARAYSDGETATVLQYAVYEGETELEDLTRSIERNNPDSINISKTVSFKLVTGNTYTVIFWAAAPNAPYTVDFGAKTMTVDYTAATTLSNDENRDAFYKRYTFTVTGAQTEVIELKRPFAQLNIGTNDYLHAEKAGYEPTKSYVKVTQLGDVLNLWNDKVEGTDAVISFDYATIPAGETFPVAGYEYLAMNYLLVNSEKEVVDIEFGYKEENTDAKTRVVGSVPVQRNYRTNIYGQLLTSDVDINVEIKPAYNEPAHEADALYLAAAVGGEVTLTEDVVLSSALNVQSNMTINLNGHTITGNWHKNDGAVIKNNATLTIVGGTISSLGENGGSAIQNSGTMVVTDATLNGAPNANGSWPSYTINNTGNLTLNNVVITSHHGAVASYGDDAVVTLNGSTIEMQGIPGFTSHGIYTYNNGKVVVNGGTYTNHATDQNASGASVINGAVTVNSGNFSGRIENYYGTPVLKGGNYTVNPTRFVAAGYKAVLVNGLYYVLPETVADAATAANVTAVTESTADVATALATDNGEATMFLWNDVAYIAKYGEVVITSSADEATTVRGVVEGASALTSATVSEGVEVVGNRTFRKCGELVTVALPNSLTEIGPAVFQSCSKLANITIPAGVTAIGEGAFAECVGLTSINIPNGVTRLEKDVLRNTGLTSIEIPASVNYIGTYAFRDCESLTEVKILAPEFTMESDSFLNAAAPFPSMTIYVANTEMKAYVESKLGAHALTYTKVIVPNTVSTSTELQTALNNVSEGEVIVLSDNFTFTEGANGTTNGISVTGAENFVLDLNGNTVTSDLGGNALRFKIGEGNGITNQNVTVTIKNGKVVSGANNWCAISATGANGNKLTLNLENIEVENNKAGDYAIKAWTGATINAKNVNVTSNAGGSFYAVGGEIVLDGCSALTTSGSAAYMAAALGISSKGKMTVNSGTYTATPSSAGGQWVVYLMSSGGEFVVNGGTFNGTVASGNASYACGLICADTGAKVTLNGGTYNSNGAILDMRNNTGGSPNPTALLAGGDYSNDPRVSGLYASNLITVADGKTVAQGSNSRWTVE